MSIKHIDHAFKLDVKGTRKLVLLALADFADPDGGCWPGQKAIGLKCSMTDRSIRKHLKQLEADGYITRTRRPRGGVLGGRTSDFYQLTFEPEASSASNGLPNRKVMTTQPEVSVIRTGSLCHSNRNTCSGEPLENRQGSVRIPQTKEKGFFEADASESYKDPAEEHAAMKRYVSDFGAEQAKLPTRNFRQLEDGTWIKEMEAQR